MAGPEQMNKLSVFSLTIYAYYRTFPLRLVLPSLVLPHIFSSTAIASLLAFHSEE